MNVLLSLLLVTYVTAAPNYDCSYGESYWCSNLNIAKKCGAVRHCMDTVWRNTDLTGMKDPDTCFICQVVVGELKDLFLDKSSEENDICQYCEQFVGDVRAQFNNQTEAQIEQFLNEACGLIPDQTLSDECKQQVDENIQQIFDMIRQSLDPKTVCSAIRLCPGFKDIVQHHKVDNQLTFAPKPDKKLKAKSTGDVCQDCKAFIGDLRDMIYSNTTETKVEGLIKEAVCAELSTYEDECNAAVDSYLPEIMTLFSETVDKVIQYLQNMCHRLVLFTKNCDNFVAAFVPKYFEFMAEAVNEVINILQTEICTELGLWKDSCDQLVYDYTPEILEILASSVDPDTVCQAFRVCKGDTFILQKMRLKKAKITKVKKLQSGELCPICEMAFQELKTLISEDTIQKDVENFIKKNLCSQLGTYQQTCEQDVDTYGALLFEMVTSEMDPTTICTTLGLCGQKKTLMKNVGQSVECVICEFIMKEVDQQIGDNATEAEIIKALDEVCNVLPDTISQQCKQFIDTYGKAILIILKETMDPQTVCTTLGLCQGTKLPERAPVGDGELCAVCETVIQYVDSLLEENATVAEIEAALDKVCNFLPDTIKGQCNDFVKQYGPMIIQLILEAANPQKVCTELKLCTSTFPVIEPMITPQKAQLVGVNECTYGPSYWCSSYAKAKKCNATKHCTAHVWKNGVPRM